nr:hypothetical protein [Methanosarcina horonobensis]
MKNSLGKRTKIDCFSEFKLENGILESGSSPAGIQESRIFKVQINLFPERWAVIILVFTLITSLVLWTYSPESSFFNYPFRAYSVFTPHTAITFPSSQYCYGNA